MVEFMSAYTPAMENFQERPITPLGKQEVDIESPIPISEIGTTSIDAGQGNILQELEKNIKMGAKKIQIVFSGRGGSGVTQGGGPSLYGVDVRKALKEKAQASGTQLVGVELSPAVVSGLAGADRNGRLSEEQRRNDIGKVRDAIRFAADVSGGGCVDMWSQEFSRNISDAEWNKKDKKFFDYSQDELEDQKKANLLKYLIDDRTGEPIRGSAIRTGDEIRRIKYQTAKDFEALTGTSLVGKKDPVTGKAIGENDFVDLEGKYIDQFSDEAALRLIPYINPKTKQFEFQEKVLEWKDLEKEKDEYNAQNKLDKERALTTEEYAFRQRLLADQAKARGQALYYAQDIDRSYDRIRELIALKDSVADIEKTFKTKEEKKFWIEKTLLPRFTPQGGLPDRERDRMLEMNPSDVVKDEIQRMQHQIQGHQEQAISARQNEDELKQTLKHIKTPFNYALAKSLDSYSDLGIDAMKVTKERGLKKPVYIGPEIGWASESFGGHPEEFTKLILESRKAMVKKLVENEKYDPDVAEQKAKTHIKGMLDTSHMAMWYKHFRRKPGQSDEAHLKEFNAWMKDEARKMVRAGVVGGVQVVDSITGEHSHLPAGQGVFDVAGIVKAMKEEKFDGPIIAEGHEEDTMNIGQGRILTETWRAFGANLGGYSRGGPSNMRGWGGMQNAYFGRVTPPTYIVGAYAPSNEWSLWSETPFE